MSNYFELQNAPVLTTPSALTAPKITSIGYPGDDTAADPAGGQTITLTGEGFEAGASVIVNNAAVGVVSVVSSTSITFTSPALSTGSYPVYVVNTDGGTAIAVPGIQYSGTPNWTTAAGSLGSYTETQAISNTVTATGDAPISYTLFSGTLPTGATLNSANGLISGTSPLSASPTTYTFTIRATDAQQQDTNRQFSLTINPDVVTWSSPANGTTYISTVNSAISNVALSATAASGQSVSYTANALPTGLSLSGSNITGTPTVVANSSTLLTATAATTNATATRTINWVISVANDPSFNYVTTLLSASNPASTFVTDASTNNFAVTVFGDTRPNNFGPYTPGYYSGYFDGTGDYLTFPPTAATSFGTGDYTIEFWIYLVGTGDFCIFDNQGSGGNSQISRIGGVLYHGSATTWSYTFTNNAWTHIAFSRQGTNLRLFANGVLQQTQTNSNVIGTAVNTNTIGIRNDALYPLNGYLSNFRIVKGTAVYTSNFTPSTTPLAAIANTSVLTCQSNRFIDNSTNNFTITRFGDTLVSGFDPFAPLSAYSTYGSGYCSTTSDFLRISPAGADSFGTGDFTVECWLNPLAATAVNLSLPSANTNTWGFLTFNGQLYWQENGSNLGGTGYGTVVQQAWNHLAVCRSGTTIRWFVNGVQVNSTTNSFNYSGAPATRNIGPGSGGSAPAYISDFRIVKGTAVYTSAFTPPTAPLTAIANTQLLTLQNNQPNNNSMFLDSSTNNFLITRNGNTTQGSFSPYGGGWSNYFDGTGDYLSLSYNAAISIISGDFTVEMWIYRTASGAEQYLWSNRSDNPGTGWEWRINSTNLMQFFFTAGSSLTSSSTIPVNTWTHLAVTRQTNTVRMFINGTQDATATFSNGTGTSASLFIGWSTSSGGLFQGYMSNARLVKGTAVYTANFTPSTTPLTPIANTSLLTCADNRFVDDSGNNFTITRNGDVSIQRFNPFNPVLTTPTSYSGYFDGNDSLSIANSSNFNIVSDFTIECWSYASSVVSGESPMFGKRASNLTYSNIVFGLNVSGGVNKLFLIGTTVSGSWNIAFTNGSITLPTGQWNHIAVVRSGTTLKTYINGVGDSTWTGVSGAFFTNTDAMTIGTSTTNGTGGYYTGFISNFRFVNGTAVYTSNFTPSTTPLTAVANTSLLTCQNATFIDNSTNNFTVTALGNSQPTQFNPFGLTTTTGSNAAYSVANYGGSMYFDGTGDFLLTPSDPAFTLGSSGDFTIECWFYLLANPGNYSPLATTWTDASLTSGYLNRWALGFFSNRLTWYTSAGNINVQDSVNIVLNQWNHVVMMKSGSTFIMYKNGVLVGSNTTTDQNYTTQGALRVGSVPSGGTINGYITNLRILRGQALYASNFAPAVAPLPAVQNSVVLLNGTGAAIYDSAMIANYETLGNASSTGVIKKYGNSSMSFDGTGDYLTSLNPSFAFGTGNFTIEAWVYSADVSSSTQRGWFQTSDTIGGLKTSYTTGVVIGFGQTGSGSPLTGAVWCAVASSSFIGSSSAVVTVNTWTHIAVVRSSGTTTIYVNGSSVGSGSTPGNCTGTNLAVGGYYNTSYLLNGYIDDLRITNGIARYTSNFTPPTTPFMQN